VAAIEGQVQAWHAYHPDFGWTGPLEVTDPGDYQNPTIAPRTDGCPIVSATQDEATELRRTEDDGETWGGVAP
jgi:hypothetical protein